MKRIDLRSDTVTQPTSEMRKAMAEAIVGDDVYGEDPTVIQLEELAAEEMGKEAGLFVASGTMGNLVAILSHCGRGDEAIVGNLGHTFLFEAGGISALGGVHPFVISNQPDGTLKLEDIQSAIRKDDVHYPISKLVVLENTHNRCGGVALTAEYTDQVGHFAHSHNMVVHMDGARIYNAATSLNTTPARLAKGADSITFCLSKALCAPVGSVLCGSKEFIHTARRIRKQVGGGMRQAGILAAAGIIAITTMSKRLGEDHANAICLADVLRQVSDIDLDSGSPQTNMIFGNLNAKAKISVPELASLLIKHGVWISVVNDNRFRLVLHHDIHKQDIDPILLAFSRCLKN